MLRRTRCWRTSPTPDSRIVEHADGGFDQAFNAQTAMPSTRMAVGIESRALHFK